MSSGSSVGDGYGPLVVAMHPMAPGELKGKRIAVPGKMTTAYLALKLFEPDFDGGGDAFRQDPGCRARALGGRRSGHSRGTTHLQQRRFPRRSGSGQVVEAAAGDCRCRWAPTPCCVRFRPSSGGVLPHDARQHPIRPRSPRRGAGSTRSSSPERWKPRWPRSSSAYTSTITRWTAATWCPQAAQRLLDMGYEAGLIARKVQVEFIR